MNLRMSDSPETDQCVSVRISHGYRPLPLVGQGMGLLGLVGGNGLVRQEVFREMSIHDEWALESEFGLSYESWIDRWEEKA